MRRWRTISALSLCLAGGAVGSAHASPYTVGWVRPMGVDPVLVPSRSVQRSQPVFSGPHVVAGTRNGLVRAYTRQKGELAWERKLPGAVEAELLPDGDNLYVATTEGHVYALDPETGGVRWEYAAGHEVLGRPAVYKDLLIFPTANNQIFALHTTDGSWAWQYSAGEDPDLSIRGVAGVRIDGDDVYTGFSDGTLARLQAATGRPVWSIRWREESRFKDIDATPIVVDGRLYTVVYGTRLLCLNTEDGGTVWTASVQAHAAPVLVGKRLYVPGLDGQLKALHADSGEQLWSKTVGSSALNSPIARDSRLYVTDSNGALTALTSDGATIWQYDRVVSGMNAPAAADSDGAVYVISNLGHLYKIQPIAWKQ